MKSVLLLLVFLGFFISPVLAGGKSDSLELKRIDEREFRFLYYKGFSTKKTLQLSSKNLAVLAIESGAGNVVIRGHNTDIIQVKAEIVLSARNLGRATTIVKEFMDLSLERFGEKALLKSSFDFHQRNDVYEAVNPNGFFSSPVRKIDLVVYVPKSLEVTVKDRSGDLSIEGIENDITVKDRSGLVEIKNTKGNLRLQDSSGDIKLVNINTGEEEKKRIIISDRSGIVRLKGANADVELSDRSGDVFIEEVEHDLTVRDRSGFLEIKNIKGNLKLKDSSGDIKLVNINTGEEEKKRITISDRSGTIKLKGANADIELFDRSGDISMDNISGNVSLTDASGHLFIEGVEGDLTLNDASGDIKATDINGNVTLSDNSGGVYVNHVTQSVHVKNAGTGDLRIRNYDGSLSGDLRRLGR